MKNILFCPLNTQGMRTGPSSSKPKSFHLNGDFACGLLVKEYGFASRTSLRRNSNNYHGALFEFLRNDVLDAKPYSFTSKPQAKSPFKWNDFGFELDGPVRIPWVFNGQNKMFFMANYEALRRRQ